MGSRRTTGRDGLRPSALSRRAVLAGTSAVVVSSKRPQAVTVLPSGPTSATSEEVSRCAAWLQIDSKIARLQTRWGRLESWLVKECGWFELSLSEQRAFPSAKELYDIEECLEVLSERREALLAALTTSGSPSFDSVIARLAVVERLIWPEENPEAHALIAGSRRDLIAIAGASAGTPPGRPSP